MLKTYMVCCTPKILCGVFPNFVKYSVCLYSTLNLLFVLVVSLSYFPLSVQSFRNNSYICMQKKINTLGVTTLYIDSLMPSFAVPVFSILFPNYKIT